MLSVDRYSLITKGCTNFSPTEHKNDCFYTLPTIDAIFINIKDRKQYIVLIYIFLISRKIKYLFICVIGHSYFYEKYYHFDFKHEDSEMVRWQLVHSRYQSWVFELLPTKGRPSDYLTYFPLPRGQQTIAFGPAFPYFENPVLLEQSHIRSFMCCLWPLLFTNGRGE